MREMRLSDYNSDAPLGQCAFGLSWGITCGRDIEALTHVLPSGRWRSVYTGQPVKMCVPSLFRRRR